MRIFGNVYYVGTNGLSALLITSPEGHVLLDGGLPEFAPLIMANIRKLGFHVEDIELIVNSHVHFDHAGGIAARSAARWPDHHHASHHGRSHARWHDVDMAHVRTASLHRHGVRRQSDTHI